MSKYSKIATILDMDLYSIRTDADPTHNYGEAVEMADQRKFRYAKASAALTAGYLYVAASPITDHHNCAAASTASVGDTQVTLTLGATAATANAYAEGYLIANDNSPEGETYLIKSNPAADASASLTLTLFTPLKTAVTTSSEFCLVHNTYVDVQASTTQTLQPAGVAFVDVTAADDFGWLQTRGVCSVLADETVAAGAEATIGSSTAGAVETKDADTEPLVANALVAGVDTEFRPMFLKME